MGRPPAGSGAVTGRGVRAWLVGITAGMVVGLLALGLAALGALLVIALVVGAAINRPHLASVGGTLVGLGIGYLYFLNLAIARCESPSCDAPDATPWLVIDLAMFGTGVVLSAAAVWSSRATGRAAAGAGRRGSRGLP